MLRSLATRHWLLLLSLSALFLLLLFATCGLDSDEAGSGGASQSKKVGGCWERVLEGERLREEVRALRLEVVRLSSNADECASYVRRQVKSAEVWKGVRAKDEHGVIPFAQFTTRRIHSVESRSGKTVVEKATGYKGRDLREALAKAVEALNGERGNGTEGGSGGKGEEGKGKGKRARYGTEDFVEGVYRTEPTTGTQYELYFRAKEGSGPRYARVRAMRPFAPLVTISREGVGKGGEKEVVHVVVALAGRMGALQSFVDKFVKIGVRNDKRTELTVVYFGEEGLGEARGTVSRAERRGGGGRVRLVALNETFSRGKGLKMGAERARGAEDVLLFMCDVDVIFSSRFLERCRWNARRGKQVYYPIVFGLYEPRVAYTLRGKDIPPESEQLVASGDTGYWRDFDYGTTCQYRSDFLRSLGSEEESVGRGGEDVLLYRKHVRSGMRVVRATDPGIFHVWHPKVCTSTAGKGGGGGEEQYRACMRSRALDEASHAQLGFLAFGGESPADVGAEALVARPRRPSRPAREKAAIFP